MRPSETPFEIDRVVGYVPALAAKLPPFEVFALLSQSFNRISLSRCLAFADPFSLEVLIPRFTCLLGRPSAPLLDPSHLHPLGPPFCFVEFLDFVTDFFVERPPPLIVFFYAWQFCWANAGGLSVLPLRRPPAKVFCDLTCRFVVLLFPLSYSPSRLACLI